MSSTPTMTARALRLWHWRKVVSLRATAQKHEQYADHWEAANPGLKNRHNRAQARNYHRNANFHLGAVQVLNDYFPPGDTAERDAQ